MNYDRIAAAIPLDNMTGKRTALRQRSDVARIVADIVLQRERLVDIAKRCKTTPEAVRRFKNRFVTDAVVKAVHVEADQAARVEADEEFNDLQDATQHGIHAILKEQKTLYGMVKEVVDADPDRLGDTLAPLMQLLRDQLKSYETLAKTYAQLKDKTTVVLSLNEHPEAAKLMEALYVVFQAHPDAFAMFKRVITDKSIALEVR